MMEPDRLARALALRDLTDPTAGVHAIQHVVAALEHALCTAWAIPVRRDPGSRIVSVADNYDRLRYGPDAITRDARYSRYVEPGRMLRSHTSARIPGLLDELARAAEPDEVLLSAPGICYRRDAIDRRHLGEPHQIDLWRIRRNGPPLDEADLAEMVALAVEAVLPDRPWHTVPNVHPYTLHGREIYVRATDEVRSIDEEVIDEEVEVGECGLAHPAVLAQAGLPAGATGLAMGLGLDRLVMLAKGVDDIRLLRCSDPRVAAQMRDLTPYRPISAMPATRRDLSLAVAAELDAELLGDRVRELLGPDADAVEQVAVLAETGCDELPAAARARMGVRPGQKNVLLRLVLRDLTRTLTAAAANALRDRVYAGLHEGSAHEWAGSSRRTD